MKITKSELKNLIRGLVEEALEDKKITNKDIDKWTDKVMDEFDDGANNRLLYNIVKKFVTNGGTNLKDYEWAIHDEWNDTFFHDDSYAFDDAMNMLMDKMNTMKWKMVGRKL